MLLEIILEKKNHHRIKVSGEFYYGENIEKITAISADIFNIIDFYFKDITFYIRINSDEGTVKIETYHPKYMSPYDFLFSIIHNKIGYYPNDTKVKEAFEKLKPYMLEIYNIIIDKSIVVKTEEFMKPTTNQQIEKATHVILYNNYILLGKIIKNYTDEKKYRVEITDILGRLGNNQKELNEIFTGNTLWLPAIKYKFLNPASAHGYIPPQDNLYSVDYLSSTDNINQDEYIDFMGEFLIKKEQLKDAIKLYIDTYNSTFDGNNHKYATMKSMITVYRELIRNEF